jgi:hypothetical protein
MIPSGVKVFLVSHPVDFRKGPDSFLVLVRDAGSDPFNGALYVFRAKRADRIKMMTELWAVEATVRGQSPEARAVVQQAVSAPIVAALFALSRKTLPRISDKSKLAEALRYAITRREIFERFLIEGRLEMDSNIVEHAIRPQTITRKNSLFA